MNLKKLIIYDFNELFKILNEIKKELNYEIIEITAENPLKISLNKKDDNLVVVKKLLSVAKNKINFGKKVKIKFVKDRPGHDIRYAINSSKIKSNLKWKPKISFAKGLEKTFIWYLENQNYYSKLNKKDITKRIGIKK